MASCYSQPIVFTKSLFYVILIRLCITSATHLSTTNPFHATGVFLYLQKTSENQKFSDVFRVYRNRPTIKLGLLRSIVDTEKTVKPGTLDLHQMISKEVARLFITCRTYIEMNLLIYYIFHNLSIMTFKPLIFKFGYCIFLMSVREFCVKKGWSRNFIIFSLRETSKLDSGRCRRFLPN